MSEPGQKELHVRLFHEVVTQSLTKEIPRELRLYLLSIISYSKEAVNDPELSATLNELTKYMSAEIINFFNIALLYITSEYWKIHEQPQWTKKKEVYSVVYQSLASATYRFENISYIAEYEWGMLHPSESWDEHRWDYTNKHMDCWLALAILVENLCSVRFLEANRDILLFPNAEFVRADQN